MTAYRNPVDALASRHATLAAELAAKTQELATAAQLLDEATAKAKLPVLDNLRVATPCSAAWAQMTGDDRVRACGACQKNVYDLSQLTRDEAEALIIAKEGKLCVRYFQRKDGTILLRDCAVGIGQKRKRRVVAAGALLLLAGSALFAYQRTHPAPAAAGVAPTSSPTTVTMPTDDDTLHVMGLLAERPDEVVETKGELSAPVPD